MAINIGYVFEVEVFRPTVANYSEFEVCLLFFLTLQL